MTGTEVLATAVATVVAALIAGLAGHFTAKSSAKGAVKAAQVTSLADLEREAGERAARIYKGAIEQLEREQVEDRGEIETLKQERAADRAEIAKLRRDIARCHDTCRALTRRLDRHDASDGPDHRP